MTTYPLPEDDGSTSDFYLENGAAAVTTERDGQYNGSARIFDFGAGPVHFDGFVFARISALTGTVSFHFEGSNAADFSSGVVEFKSVSVASLPATDLPYLISNQVGGVYYRYGRVRITPGGSTPTSTSKLWLKNKDSLDTSSLDQLVGIMSVVMGRFNDAVTLLRNWSAGTPTGGPDSDGKFPLYDSDAIVSLVECPAKIVALLAGGLTTAGFDALGAQTVWAGDNPDPEIAAVTTIDGVRALRKMSPFIFTSRKTSDLADWTLGDDAIPTLIASVTDSRPGGLEYKIAMKQLLRMTTGVVNPVLEYGARNDAIIVRHTASFTSGSNVLQIGESLFVAADVGKTVQVGNGLGGGIPLIATIITYNSPTEVVLSANFASNQTVEDVVWGWIATSTLQQALDAVKARSVYTYGGIVLLPPGGYFAGALKYHARSGIHGHGRRQTTLYRHDDAAIFKQQFAGSDNPSATDSTHNDGDFPAPSLYNATSSTPTDFDYLYGCDFPSIGNMTINGTRFTCAHQYPGFQFRSRIYGIDPPLPQLDPSPNFINMDIIDVGWNSFELRNANSGTASFIDVYGGGAVGLWSNAFDLNFIHGLFYNCDGPGLWLDDSGAANSNWVNLKVSFNGKNLRWLLGDAGACNVFCGGEGHNFQNMRAQESYGANIIINGVGHNFQGCQADDTGCIYPAHGLNDLSTLPSARAAYLLYPGVNFCNLNDCGYGPAVHPGKNYATHGVYFLGGFDSVHEPRNMDGRVKSKNVTVYDGVTRRDTDYFDDTIKGDALLAGGLGCGPTGSIGTISGIDSTNHYLTVDHTNVV